MKIQFTKSAILLIAILPAMLQACNGLLPLPTEETPQPQDTSWRVSTALPNDASGIEGVQTYGDRPEYHNHVDVVTTPDDNIPPVFGEHFRYWQNCGIYDQPLRLGNALHSMEHGAVWLTYSQDLNSEQVADLKSLVRGHDYVLMSPYPSQSSPVVLTAWGAQLIIDSLPDDRIEKFIAYYENGPQNPEPGAPCSGAVGIPLP